MTDQDFTHVLSAFQQVNVHYLVTAEGDSILTRMLKPNPKVNEVTSFGVFMYFNPKDAETAKAQYERSGGKAQIRSVSATKILGAQFARRNAPTSQGIHERDYIILLSLEPKIDVIEHLVGNERAPLAIKQKDGRLVIPAFIDAAEANEQQRGLAARGTPADRVGQDERTFLGFILAQAKLGRLVVVRGFK